MWNCCKLCSATVPLFANGTKPTPQIINHCFPKLLLIFLGPSVPGDANSDAEFGMCRSDLDSRSGGLLRGQRGIVCLQLQVRLAKCSFCKAINCGKLCLMGTNRVILPVPFRCHYSNIHNYTQRWGKAPPCCRNVLRFLHHSYVHQALGKSTPLLWQ